MGLNFVAEYLKIPLEIAVDLRKRQDRSSQAQEKMSQGAQTNGTETFQYYENSTMNNGTIPLSPTLSEYIERRFIPTLYWYQNKARSNSMKFNIWKIVIISTALFLAILNALALGLTNQNVNNSLVTLASAVAAIVILTSFAYLQASKIHESIITNE
jgi:anti-sigma-K factor RskA